MTLIKVGLLLIDMSKFICRHSFPTPRITILKNSKIIEENVIELNPKMKIEGKLSQTFHQLYGNNIHFDVSSLTKTTKVCTEEK